MTQEPQDFRIRTQSLQAGALDRLRQEIIDGVWKPGERLQERLLCQRFGISRSPLREAYQVLAAEGLLDLLRNRGAVVTAPSLDDVMQNHVLLEALETLSIGLACENASDAEIAAIEAKHEEEKRTQRARDDVAAFHLNNDLHRMIVLASHNQPVIDAHLIVQRRIIRMQNINGLLYQQERAPPGAEHEEFVRALMKRAKAQAVKAMKNHLAHVKENLQERLKVLARNKQTPTAVRA
jgi:DNA-binding GntR family transcriptional regulator